jgi:hypothetical protein
VALLGEKQGLEKQLISYLSMFNKVGFEEGRTRRPDNEDLPIEDLLAKLSRLEASFSGLHSSKRELLERMAGESFEGELSSVKRRDRPQ